MVYKIYSISEEKFVKTFDSRALLLNYLCRCELSLNNYGHNPNDIISYHSYDNSCQPYRQYINYIIYDEFNRVVDLPTLKEELKDYKYNSKIEKVRYGPNRKNRVFRYRLDPVPGIHKSRYICWFRPRVKKGKREYSILSEYKNLARAKYFSNKKYLVNSWGDDHYKTIERNWKSQGKKNESNG